MKTISIAAIFVFALLAFACDDDEEVKTAPLVGKWEGTHAEVEFQPYGIPIPVSKTDDSFDYQIEFRGDNTVVIDDGTQSVEGTWELQGNLLITDITLDTDFINLSGTYTLEELNDTTLIIYIEKEDQKVTDPDSGQTISGDVKATLHFQRI